MSDINQALEAIQKHQRSVAEASAEKIKGEQGPRGERGLPGQPAVIEIGSVKTGASPAVRCEPKPDNTYALQITLPEGVPGPAGPEGQRGEQGPSINLAIGNVRAGEAASASLRQSEGVTFLDLCLPRGLRGERGERGPEGAPSTTPGPVGPRGERGEAGTPGVGTKGDRGEKGDPAFTKEELVNICVEILTDAGVANEHVRRLFQIRAMLKKKMNSATSRSIAEISDLVKSVDNLFEE